MISDLLSTTVLVGILASGIRLATPYLYAAIGEMFGQRSGVLNLGVEGQMLLGSFAAFYVVQLTGNLWLGVLAAVIVGAAMGLAMAYRARASLRTPAAPRSASSRQHAPHSRTPLINLPKL